MFPQAIRKTLFALLISQMTFMGYTLVRKGVFQVSVGVHFDIGVTHNHISHMLYFYSPVPDYLHGTSPFPDCVFHTFGTAPIHAAKQKAEP